jgi:hypothetical protein
MPELEEGTSSVAVPPTETVDPVDDFDDQDIEFPPELDFDQLDSIVPPQNVTPLSSMPQSSLPAASNILPNTSSTEAIKQKVPKIRYYLNADL